MKIISACLVGVNCKYDGKNNKDKIPASLFKEFKKGKLIPVCPEQLGGFCTPRDPAQIIGGTGLDVIEGRAQVITNEKVDVTIRFLKGAAEVLNIALAMDIKEAILKQKSPSCGCGQIHDGTFSKNIIKGDGVTTAYLKINGIKVKTEEDFK